MAGVRELIDELLFPNRRRNVIPSLDGPLSVNTLLDGAPVMAELNELHDVAIDRSGGLWVAAGTELLRLEAMDSKSATSIRKFATDVTSVTVLKDGGVLVGVSNLGLCFVGGARDGAIIEAAAGRPLHCATAAIETENGDIFACEGSTQNIPAKWRQDLMEKNRSGRILRIAPGADRADLVAEALGFPYGICMSHDGGSLLVTEAWQHQVLKLPLAEAVSGSSRPQPVRGLDNLPGYPARIARTQFGYALAIMAMRTQLVDFILTEDEFRNAMMQRVPVDFWASPQLYAPGHFLDPVQGGGLKKHGSLNPWAPPRSYGLVIYLDRSLDPVASFHSRVGGTAHGMTAVVEAHDAILALSSGCGKIVKLPAEIS